MVQKFYATSNPESQGSETTVHGDLDGWQRSKWKRGRKVWPSLD